MNDGSMCAARAVVAAAAAAGVKWSDGYGGGYGYAQPVLAQPYLTQPLSLGYAPQFAEVGVGGGGFQGPPGPPGMCC